jgi:hypothetical protein
MLNSNMMIFIRSCCCIAIAVFALGIVACDSENDQPTMPDNRLVVDSAYGRIWFECYLTHNTCEKVDNAYSNWEFFLRQNPLPIDVGAVTLGDAELDQYGSNPDTTGVQYYLQHPMSFFDGRAHTLRSAGNEAVAPYVDSVYFPPAPVIIGMRADDTIILGNEFQLQWDSVDFRREITITIHGAEDFSRTYQRVVPDVGTLTIDSDSLKQFPSGDIWIGLARSASGKEEEAALSYRGEPYDITISLFRRFYLTR